MKFKILRVCVLLVSVSAASVLVWYAAQKKPEQKHDNTILTEEMQGSSKSRVVVGADNIREISQGDLAVSPKSGPILDDEELREMVEPRVESAVTEEEVKKMRDMMMSTSKSGRIMSDEDIRKMLEDQKKEALEIKSKLRLMPSSKSIAPIFEPKDVKNFVEDKTPEK